ncbi:MAG: PQQ-binding-like beta-propeller repeat protein [Planctomycetota bacterium]
MYAGGSGKNGLMAFDCNDGSVRWTIASTGMNFGSAQPAIFDGEEMLMFSVPEAVLGVDPADGAVLWRYATKAGSTPPIVQPQQFAEDGAIIPFGDDNGIARIDVTRREDGTWSVDENWRTRNLKPWYSDFLIHDGAIFGFDKNIFTSLDLSNCSRHWKQGRFGFGQAILLEKNGQVIVTTEKGDVILLDVSPRGLQERGRFSALNGKSWNHPVVANGRLYVRGESELVCYEL